MGILSSLRGKPKISEQERIENAIQVAGLDDPLSTTIQVDTYSIVEEVNSTHLRYIMDKEGAVEFLQLYGIFKDKEIMMWHTCTVLIDGERLTGQTQLVKTDADAEMNWTGGYDGVSTEHVVFDIPIEYIDRLAGMKVRWNSQQTGQNRDFEIGSSHANAFANVVANTKLVAC